MISLKNISKSFKGDSGGTIRVLSGFSMELKAGDFSIVRGPGGCGKTTLMLIAGGLMAPDSGTVDFVTADDIYAMPPDELALFRARNVGFLFHRFHLLPCLTVLDNIMVPDLAEPFPESAERAETLLRKLKIVEHRNHKPSELTIGERQKAALARAMLHMPRLLLADEPIANLDANSSSAILAALLEYAEMGNCVMMFTKRDDIPLPKSAILAELRNL